MWLAASFVEVRESAEQVSVSRQPADQLTRSKAWRDPVERVASVDLSAIEAMKGLWERTTKVTHGRALDALDARAYQLRHNARSRCRSGDAGMPSSPAGRCR